MDRVSQHRVERLIAAVDLLKASGVADPVTAFRRELREKLAVGACSAEERDETITTLALLEGVDALSKRDPALWH